MLRRTSILIVLCAGVASLALQGQRPAFTVVEATIPEMRAALEQHRVTSVQLVTLYLNRIAIYEDKLHAALTVNPDALKDAADRDRELDYYTITDEEYAALQQRGVGAGHP